MSARQIQVRIDRDRAAIERATQSYRGPDGRLLRIARFGAGPPLICVPMVPEISFAYMPQIEHLSHRFEVMLYEPRTSRTRRVTVEDRQAELHDVIDALGQESVHLLAWSDGGAVAYRAVRSRPENFRSLALLGLAERYRFPWPLHAYAQLLYRYPIDRCLPSVAAAALLARYLGGSQFSRRCLFQEARRIEGLPQYLRRSILPIMLEHEPDDGGVPLPAVLIGGNRDALVPVDSMRRMTQHLNEEAEFVLVSGGEHVLGYTFPQPVNEALDAFYARVTGESPAFEANC